MPSKNSLAEVKQSELRKTPTLPTNDAPKLKGVTREPKRMQKALYIQEKYSQTFDKLVFDQRRTRGKKSTQLAEEAFELLFQKYGDKYKT